MEPVITSILVGLLITGVGAFLGAYFKKRANKKSKIEKLEEEVAELKTMVETLRKANWRLKKAVIIMAKILDAQVTKYHDDESPDLVNITEELLDEEEKD